MSRHTHLVTLALAASLVSPLPALGQTVGTTTAVIPDAHARIGTAQPRRIELGDAVIHNQLIETDTNGTVQVLLADRTTFTLGPNTSLRIDSFVYDPDTDTADLVATASRGIFRFIGGAASKEGKSASVNTPMGIAGIRGAIVNMVLEPVGSVQQGITLVYGEQVTLTTNDGAEITLDEPGQSYVQLANGERRVISTTTDMIAGQQAAMTSPQATTASPQATAATVQDSIDFYDQSLTSLGNLAGLIPGNSSTNTSSDLTNNGVFFPITPRGDDTPDQQGIEDAFEEQNSGHLPPPPRGSIAPSPLDGTHQGFTSGTVAGGPATGEAEFHFDALGRTFSGHLTASNAAGGGAYTAETEDSRLWGRNYFSASSNDGYLQTRTSDELCTSCEFMNWGIWVSSPATGGGVERGHWIAGDMTTTSQIDDLYGTLGTATYSGNAVGTLYSGGLERTATGQMSGLIDFDERSGRIDIENFGADGERYDFMYGIGFDHTNRFTSDMTTFGDDKVDGFAHGGFFNDGTQIAVGIGGAFEIDAGTAGWAASGVFGGRMDGPR